MTLPDAKVDLAAFGDLMRAIWTLEPTNMSAALMVADLFVGEQRATVRGVDVPLNAEIPGNETPDPVKTGAVPQPQRFGVVFSPPFGVVAMVAYVSAVLTSVKNMIWRAVLLLIGPLLAYYAWRISRRFQSGVYQSSVDVEAGGEARAPWA